MSLRLTVYRWEEESVYNVQFSAEVRGDRVIEPEQIVLILADKGEAESGFVSQEHRVHRMKQV